MKREYTQPEIAIATFVAEKGFALSFGVGIIDYSKNDEDELDD